MGYEPWCPDVSQDFPQEVAYIVKHLGVAYRDVRITDHPCGEWCIWVKRNGEERWMGYVDSDFHFAMDVGQPWWRWPIDHDA